MKALIAKLRNQAPMTLPAAIMLDSMVRVVRLVEEEQRELDCPGVPIFSDNKGALLKTSRSASCAVIGGT